MLSATTKLAPVTLGINNRRDAFDLPRGAVRDAVNVDLTDSGLVRRRKGITAVIPGTSVRSMTTIEGRTFFADGVTLYEFRNGGKTALWTQLDPHADVVFENWPGRGICFSDATSIKLIVGPSVLPIAVNGVNHPLTITSAPGGSLRAGVYQVACTFLNAVGEESGCLDIASIEVNDGDKITVVMPVPVESETASTAIYVSDANDSVLGRLRTVPSTGGTQDIAVIGALGRVLSLDPKQPLPAGDLLAFCRGKMYSHLAGIVSKTDAYSGLYSPVSGYIPFSEPLTIMAAIDPGLFFVGDRTFWIDASQNEPELQLVLPTGGVKGTLVRLPDTQSVMWFSERGLVLGEDGGKTSYLQDNNLSLATAIDGASIHRDQDGLRQVITSLRNPGVSSGEGSTWFEASISTGEVRNDF